MGIVIHFTATIADYLPVATVLDAVATAAELRGWKPQRFSKSDTTLSRDFGEGELQYSGPSEGVVMTPHEMCDPFCLEFDSNRLAQDFVKTQFAGLDVHVNLVELLREIEPKLQSLDVFDEGEYWQSNDRERLKQLLDECNKQLDQELRTNPEARGPLQLENGRWVDLIRVEAEKPWWRVW